MRTRSKNSAAALGTAGVFGLLLTLTSFPGSTYPKVVDNHQGVRNWPMLGGSRCRNMANPFEKNIPATWVVKDGEKKNLKWITDLGSKAYGGPVIANGKVFIGTNNQRPRNPKFVDPKGRPFDLGVLMCFREADGQFLWQAVHSKLPAGRVSDWPLVGLVSMPVVENNRLYYVSNRCELICADTEGFLDGKNDGLRDETDTGLADADIIWRLDMIKELQVFPHNLAVCSPLLVGDLVFVITGNGVDEGHVEIPQPQAPSFLAVHKKTGKVIWQNNSPTVKLLGVQAKGKERSQAIEALRNRGELLLHAQWSNPVYAQVNGKEQVIFPGGDGWLRAFEPKTGFLLWKFDCNPKEAIFHLSGRSSRNEFLATPVVHDDRLYIGVGQDPEHESGVGHLWCIDLANALEKGRINPDGDVSPIKGNFNPNAAVNRDSALAWHYGGEAPYKDQARLRRKYHFGRTLSSCAVHNGLVYAAELAGLIHCLDAEKGTVYWTHDTRAPIWSSPFYVDGKVYLGTDDETVWVFAHGKEKRVLAENEVPSRVRGVPVAANGVLYIATENALIAFAHR